MEQQQKQEGLDLGTALFLLKTRGPESVLQYMVRTIMEILGIKVTEKGVTEFSDWTVIYAQKLIKEECDVDMDRENTIKNLITLSLQSMPEFLDIMRNGILAGAGKVAGYNEKEIKDLLSTVQYDQEKEG